MCVFYDDNNHFHLGALSLCARKVSQLVLTWSGLNWTNPHLLYKIKCQIKLQPEIQYTEREHTICLSNENPF